MVVIAYPLNNKDYVAEDAMIYNCTRTSGVYALSGNLALTPVIGVNSTVRLSMGVAWINYDELKGIAAAVKIPLTLTLAPPHASLSRIDVVVMRYSAANNNVTIAVKEGTAASNPTLPTRSTEPHLYELFLHSIRVNPGNPVEVLGSNITDLRGNENYCGLMSDGITRFEIERLMPALVSQQEAEAGTNTTVRSWSALRVRQAARAIVDEVQSGIHQSLAAHENRISGAEAALQVHDNRLNAQDNQITQLGQSIDELGTSVVRYKLIDSLDVFDINSQRSPGRFQIQRWSGSGGVNTRLGDYPPFDDPVPNAKPWMELDVFDVRSPVTGGSGGFWLQPHQIAYTNKGVYRRQQISNAEGWTAWLRIADEQDLHTINTNLTQQNNRITDLESTTTEHEQQITDIKNANETTTESINQISQGIDKKINRVPGAGAYRLPVFTIAGGGGQGGTGGIDGGLSTSKIRIIPTETGVEFVTDDSAKLMLENTGNFVVKHNGYAEFAGSSRTSIRDGGQLYVYGGGQVTVYDAGKLHLHENAELYGNSSGLFFKNAQIPVWKNIFSGNGSNVTVSTPFRIGGIYAFSLGERIVFMRFNPTNLNTFSFSQLGRIDPFYTALYTTIFHFVFENASATGSRNTVSATTRVSQWYGANQEPYGGTTPANITHIWDTGM